MTQWYPQDVYIYILSCFCTFFLFLCLDLEESCPIPPFPSAPDGVFPRCCCPAGAGGVGVGGGVFSGDSRPVFTPAACPKRCGYEDKMPNSSYGIKSQTGYGLLSSTVRRDAIQHCWLILVFTITPASQQCMPCRTYCTCICWQIWTWTLISQYAAERAFNRERGNFH